MKSICLIAALILLVSAPLSILAADEGADVYKSKCLACHGEKGEGKPAIKMPAVKGTTMTAEQIVEYITKGQAGKRMPHNNPVNGVDADQAKAVAEYVKTLK
jgi:mono/diheme cytochrome c family protein